MPFDHHDHGGEPHRNDPRHQPIRPFVVAVIEAAGIAAKRKGLCMNCAALQLAASSLAVFLMQQDAVNPHTGEVDPDLMERILQRVTDVAMEEVNQTVEGYKARKARDG